MAFQFTPGRAPVDRVAVFSDVGAAGAGISFTSRTKQTRVKTARILNGVCQEKCSRRNPVAGSVNKGGPGPGGLGDADVFPPLIIRDRIPDQGLKTWIQKAFGKSC